MALILKSLVNFAQGMPSPFRVSVGKFTSAWERMSANTSKEIDIPVLIYVWLLSLIFTFGGGHVVGYIQGLKEAKASQGYKFENTPRAFASEK